MAAPAPSAISGTRRVGGLRYRARMTRQKSKSSDPIGDGLIALLHYGALAGMAYVLLTLAARGLHSVLGPSGVQGVLSLAGLAFAAWAGLKVRRRLRARQNERAWAVRQAEQDRQLHTADQMTGAEFERLVARLLVRDRLVDVRVAGGACDRGADVFAATAEGDRVVVQCKRYQPNRAVTSQEMQLFVGMAWHEHRAQKPLYVTTSRFTREAQAIAAKNGIYLIGRNELGQWMQGSHAFATASAPILA